jgi:hypothetical protein
MQIRVHRKFKEKHMTFDALADIHIDITVVQSGECYSAHQSGCRQECRHHVFPSNISIYHNQRVAADLEYVCIIG